MAPSRRGLSDGRLRGGCGRPAAAGGGRTSLTILIPRSLPRNGAGKAEPGKGKGTDAHATSHGKRGPVVKAVTERPVREIGKSIPRNGRW